MPTPILLKEVKKFREPVPAALQMPAEKHAVELFPEHETNLTEAKEQLSAYDEVAEDLQMSRESDFRLAVLINGVASTADTQIEFARLTGYFEKVLSAEDYG